MLADLIFKQMHAAKLQTSENWIVLELGTDLQVKPVETISLQCGHNSWHPFIFVCEGISNSMPWPSVYLTVVFKAMWFELLFKYNIYNATMAVQFKDRSAAYHCILKSFRIITTFGDTAVQISGARI